MRADRPTPTAAFLIGGFVYLGLAVAVIVLSVEGSWIALPFGAIAVIGALSLVRWSKRGAFR